MIDPQTYEDADRTAMIYAANWPTIRAMRPQFFLSAGFPSEIKSLQELRYIGGSLHSSDAWRSMKELRGIRQTDLATIVRACARYIDFQVVMFGHQSVSIPVAELLNSYILYRKISRMSVGRRILDIGPGASLLPLFLADDTTVQTYSQIEVTQSLFLFQAALNSFLFREAHRSLVMPAPHYKKPTIGSKIVNMSVISPTVTVRPVYKQRSTLYPWWRTADAYAQSYDLIMSNENICEMSEEALVHHCEMAQNALTDDGLFLIHGIGATKGDPEIFKNRMELIAHLKFKSVLFEPSTDRNGTLARPNRILIGPRHPAYKQAWSIKSIRQFDPKDPFVKRVFGYDEPEGDINDTEGFIVALSEALVQAGLSRPPKQPENG
jgi:hypothetical protein